MKKVKKKLDFIVIGAAKSGTTTLFELAKGHPELFIPRDKELPYFSDKSLYKKGMEWYLDTYFPGHSTVKKLWGTVTPQYMLGEGHISPEKIAAGIKKESPEAKIVAILRNPIERAYSHYHMLVQRGHFQKSFQETTDKLLKNKSLDDFRSGKNDIDDTNTFLLGSEYGRLLSYYYDNFPKKQILILFMDDLKNNPEDVLKTFFNFLGVDEDYRPDTLGKEFRKGGSKAKLKVLTPGFLYKIPLVEKIWKDYTPYVIRKRIEYSINLWNIKPEKDAFGPNDPAYKKLEDFYSFDIKKLEKLIGQKVSWRELH